MPSRKAKEKAVSAAVMRAMRQKEENTLRRNSSRSCRPHSIENTAPLPRAKPSRMEVRKVIRV